jgi:hypothetical protein
VATTVIQPVATTPTATTTPVVTHAVGLTPTITLTTPTGSLALPPQPFLLRMVSAATPTRPAVFVLQTLGGSLAFTAPFTFTSPLFSFSSGMTPATPAAQTPFTLFV